jgi:hypothetical protein
VKQPYKYKVIFHKQLYAHLHNIHIFKRKGVFIVYCIQFVFPFQYFFGTNSPAYIFFSHVSDSCTSSRAGCGYQHNTKAGNSHLIAAQSSLPHPGTSMHKSHLCFPPALFYRPAFSLPGFAPKPGPSNQRKTSVALCMLCQDDKSQQPKENISGVVHAGTMITSLNNPRKTSLALCMPAPGKQARNPPNQYPVHKARLTQEIRPDFGLLLVMLFLNPLIRIPGTSGVFFCPNWGIYAQTGVGLYVTKSLWERPLHSAFSILFRKLYFLISIARPKLWYSASPALRGNDLRF